MTNGKIFGFPALESKARNNDLQPNTHRIWVCEECECIFTDEEIRKSIAKNPLGHKCKGGCRGLCESHLEPFLPELNG